MHTARLALAREEDGEPYSIVVVDAKDNLILRIYVPVEELQALSASIDKAFPKQLKEVAGEDLRGNGHSAYQRTGQEDRTAASA